MALYKVVRRFSNSGRKVLVANYLTLEDAQEHCRNPEASSSTCTKPENIRRTRRYGSWFDGYEEM